MVLSLEGMGLGGSKNLWVCTSAFEGSNIDRQMDVSLAAEVKREFIRVDRESGKDFNRIAYQFLLTRFRQGDTLVIKELDRLGRNYEAIKEQWQRLTVRGVIIRVLDMPILDTSIHKDGMFRLIQNIVLELLSYIAESERIKIKQRQKEGILLAKQNGTILGRPTIEMPSDFPQMYKKWKAGEITALALQKQLGLSKSTFYRMVNKYENQTVSYT